MKIIITILFLFSFIYSEAQDRELFKYINDYRLANDLKELVWSNDMLTIAGKVCGAISDTDSLQHSGTNTYEVALMGNSLPNTPEDKTKFNNFTKLYFNIEYNNIEGLTHEELVTFNKMFMLYLWSVSDIHRKIILDKRVKTGACDSQIKGAFIYIDNCIEIQGKPYYFNKIIPHYTIDYNATLTIR